MRLTLPLAVSSSSATTQQLSNQHTSTYVLAKVHLPSKTVQHCSLKRPFAVCLQGLPMLLGSFGTFAILLFGKPEAEAVRLWPIIAGQLGATAIAISMIQLFGASLLTRACALSATVMYMMWTDTLHPPGGGYYQPGRLFDS